MALRRDDAAQWQKLIDRVRRLENRRVEFPPAPAFQLTHTVIAGGPIMTSLYIPPYVIRDPYTGEAPSTDDVQRVWVLNYGHFCRVGTVSIDWYLNSVSTWGGAGVPKELTGISTSRIRPVITAASSDAEDLTAWFQVRYAPGESL